MDLDDPIEVRIGTGNLHRLDKPFLIAPEKIRSIEERPVPEDVREDDGGLFPIVKIQRSPNLGGLLQRRMKLGADFAVPFAAQITADQFATETLPLCVSPGLGL